METIIWVDADSFPKKARSFVLKKALENHLKVIYAANHEISFDFESSLFKMIICPEGKNSADDYIAENVKQDDIVLTRDLPLAKRLVDKKITVINDRGTLFNTDNLEKMLKDRELSIQLSSIGVNMGARWNSYGTKELSLFKKCFETVLNSLLK